MSSTEYYISRTGEVDGPYSQEKLLEMHRSGAITSEVLTVAAGEQDWKPLKEHLTSLSGQMPPALPAIPVATAVTAAPATSSAHLNVPMLVDGKVVNGTQGKTVEQIMSEVAQGGRFVVFQYAFSIIVMSFKRSCAITYLPPGDSGTGKAFGWSLLSFCVGWWGIPWGIFYTISAIFRNTGGGVDVTEPLMSHYLGEAEADRLVKARPKLATGGLWGLRALFLLGPVVVITAFGAVMSQVDVEREARMAAMPGYAASKVAKSFIQSSTAQSGGNTSAAKAAAGGVSTMLHEFRETAFDTSVKGVAKLKVKPFRVWCEERPGHILFIVEIPELRRYDSESKDAMAVVSWIAAQTAATQLAAGENAKFAVAIRGDYIYDRLLSGTYPQKDLDKIEERLPPEVKVETSGVEEAMLPYFAGGPATAAPQP